MYEIMIVGVILLFSSGMGFLLAWYAWRYGTGREGRFFSLMMLALAFYSIMILMELMSSSIEAKTNWSKLQYLFMPHVPPLWFLFAASYGAFDRWLSYRRSVILWAIPVGVMLLALSNEWHGLVWRDIHWVDIDSSRRVIYVHGPAVWVLAFYSYALLLLGSGLLLLVTFRSARLYKSQRVALIVASLAPMTGNLLYISGLSPIEGIDLAPLLFALTGILLAWAMFRLRLLQVMPVAYDAVLEGMHEGMILIDSRRQIVDLNSSARCLLGISGDVIGAPAGDVLGQWPELAALTEGTFEMPGLAKAEWTQSGAWLEASVNPFQPWRGPNRGWLALLRDISDRKQTEEAKRRLDAQIVHTQKLESLGLLAGGIAHDFNNMFMVIHGNIELAMYHFTKDDPGYELLRNACDMIKQASAMAGEMVAYAGQGRIALSSENLTELLLSLTTMIRISIPETVCIDYQLDEHLPLVEVDAEQIRQMIMNLARNAAEAIEETPGSVSFSTGVVDCDEGFLEKPYLYGQISKGPYVYLRVTDSGCGMEPDVLDRIFDPFYTSKFIGRGLGLAATLGIMRAHGGMIQVESQPGAGSSFTLYFPVLKA